MDEEALHTISPSSGGRQLVEPHHRRSVHYNHQEDTNASKVDDLGNSSRDLDVSNNKRVGLPLSTGKINHEPPLIHPLLHKVPLQVRFGVNGLISNVLFMVVYNTAVILWEDKIEVTTIYAVVYFFFIPLGHLFGVLLVFGWPERYFSSLMSNFPIGLTAIAIGGLLTGYLDSLRFSDRVDEYIRQNFSFSKMPPRDPNEQHQSEFWSSVVVLVVTSIWTYVLSIYVNQSPTKSEKKEL